jgi:hypothetical protein
MRAILRGFRTVDFTPQNGEPVKGTKIFYGFGADGVTGEETADNFLRDEMLGKLELKVGGIYNLEFSNKGKLIRIDKME